MEEAIEQPMLFALCAKTRTDYLTVGFPPRSLTRKPRANGSTLLVLSIAVTMLSACNGKDALIEKNWIIISGEFEGKPIVFKSTDQLQFADASGRVNAELYFFEDGVVALPGINSPEMRGQWHIEHGKLFMSLDSARYRSIDEGIAEWESEQLAGRLQSQQDSITVKPQSELESGVFTAAMKIYADPFSFVVRGEQLTLQSKTTRITAYRDRSIDKMFNGL